jgi:hypothetical protein
MEPIGSRGLDDGVRFDLVIGPVRVRCELRKSLRFDIVAADERSGPLVEASHRVSSLYVMNEILGEALRQFEYYATADPEHLDWGDLGVPWWDESKDEYLARAWLERPGRVMDQDDVDARILELTQSDLDPARGWRLVKTMVDLATTDDQLWRIGAHPLAPMASNHGALIEDELRKLYLSDPKWRKPLDGQMAIALNEFKEEWQRQLPQKRQSGGKGVHPGSE